MLRTTQQEYRIDEQKEKHGALESELKAHITKVDSQLKEEVAFLKQETVRANEAVNTHKTTSQRAIENFKRDCLKRFTENDRQSATAHLKLEELKRTTEA